MAYGVCYEVKLYAHFAIDAECEHDALEIAESLLFSDYFRELKLVPALDDPWQWGDALNDCMVYPDRDYDGSYPVLDVSEYVRD